MERLESVRMHLSNSDTFLFWHFPILTLSNPFPSPLVSGFCPLNPLFTKAEDGDIGTYYEPTVDGKLTKIEADQKCHHEFDGAHLPFITSLRGLQSVQKVLTKILGTVVIA